MGLVEEMSENVRPGDKEMTLVVLGPWSIDLCPGYGVSDTFNKFDRLGFRYIDGVKKEGCLCG